MSTIKKICPTPSPLLGLYLCTEIDRHTIATYMGKEHAIGYPNIHISNQKCTTHFRSLLHHPTLISAILDPPYIRDHSKHQAPEIRSLK